MGSIIIAMPNYEYANHLSEIIGSHGLLTDIEVCWNASEVLRTANAREYGVVICTKNLKDMGFMELSGYLPQYFGMIILTKDVGLEIYAENTIKLMMPFKSRELISTIEMMFAGFVRQIKKKKNGPIKRSAAEQKIIDEAKGLLMVRNGMSEPEAFRYIQKTSMDTGRSMCESAQMILMFQE